MSWETWFLFVVTETVLCLTPGPAVLLVLSQALTRGARASVWSNLGILAGNTMYFVLSATGLGAILLASHDLFLALKWIGAAYLIWLGVGAFRGTSGVIAVRPADPTPIRPARMALNGFVLQAANPKALMFFAALLPQFLDPAGDVAAQVAILGVTSVAIEFTVLVGYGLLAGRATAYATRPAFARTTNRIAGGLLMIAGIGMAALRRS